MKSKDVWVSFENVSVANVTMKTESATEDVPRPEGASLLCDIIVVVQRTDGVMTRIEDRLVFSSALITVNSLEAVCVSSHVSFHSTYCPQVVMTGIYSLMHHLYLQVVCSCCWLSFLFSLRLWLIDWNWVGWIWIWKLPWEDFIVIWLNTDKVILNAAIGFLKSSPDAKLHGPIRRINEETKSCGWWREELCLLPR